MDDEKSNKSSRDTSPGENIDLAAASRSRAIADKENDLENSQPPAQSQIPPAIDASAFPDGGLQAWLVVLGGWCAVAASFGWINCIGIFQTYYQTDYLNSYSSSTIAWIPSIESFCMFFWGPVAGKLTDDYGPRFALLLGSFLHIFGLFMLSLSKKYYQILLTQAFISGTGCSFIFYPTLTAVASWFLRHRALAFGIIVSGSSVGGVFLPIMATKLFDQIGFAWTIRALAFLLLGLVIVANLLIKSRLKPVKKPFAITDFLEPFQEPTYSLVTVGCFFIYLGGFLPFNFIELSGRANGMSTALAGFLIPILNASSTFGRIIPAHFGDIYGTFNVMIVMSSLGGIIVLALWLPATSNVAIIFLGVIYGFASGCMFSIIPAMVASISDVRKLGVRTGSLYICCSFGALVGSPIAGAIQNSQDGSYSGLIVFSGVCILAGVFCIVLSRTVKVGLRVMVKM